MWGAVPLVGFNECLALILPITIAACFPAGITERVHLTIHLIEGSFGRSLRNWLNALSALLLLLFFAMMSWRIGLYAQELGDRHAQTTILRVPTAPAFWAVAVLVAACVPAQLIVVLKALVVAVGYARRPPESTAAPVEPERWRRLMAFGVALTVIAVLGVFAAAFRVVGWPDFLPKDPVAVAALFFVAAWLLILALVPLGVALVLAGMAGIATTLGTSTTFAAFGMTTASFLSNTELAVLPLFLMMGSFAISSGMSSDLYRFAHTLFGHFRGGLALATIGGCASFGAVTGLSVATVSTIGRVALPEMLQRGYSPALATGSVAAGGTLGILVPPSGALVLYALLTDQPIGLLFIAALVPAAIATLFYMIVVAVYVRLNSGAAPAVERASWPELLQAATASWGMVVLFVVVVGGIYGGVSVHRDGGSRHRGRFVLPVRAHPRTAVRSGVLARCRRDGSDNRDDLCPADRRLDLFQLPRRHRAGRSARQLRGRSASRTVHCHCSAACDLSGAGLRDGFICDNGHHSADFRAAGGGTWV
jgi:TRAP-type C4-dicarboxylate transport system permease small subunit